MWYKYNKIIGEILAMGFFCDTIIYMDKGKTVFPPYFERGKQMTNAKKTQTAEAINVTTPATIVADLSKARGNVVNIAGKTGEVLKAYSVAMCQAFNLVDNQGNVTTAWFDLKGKLKAGVNDEYKAFKEAMSKAGHEKNVHVYWQRVKEFSGYQTAGQRAKGNETLEAKTVADLKTIINRIFKAEENGEESKASEVKGLLMTAFETLGGDVMTLG